MTYEQTETLKERWRKALKLKNPLCEEWQNSLEAVSKWAEENGYDGGVNTRIRWEPGPDGIIGPNSARIIRFFERLPEDYTPKPGYKNRPCVECDRERYCNALKCERYKAWWDVSMAAYRRALGIGGKNGK